MKGRGEKREKPRETPREMPQSSGSKRVRTPQKAARADGRSSQSRSSGPWLPALVTTALAMILRILYLVSSSDNPFQRNLGLDMEGYHDWARSILEGGGLGPAPFTQAPFHPVVLSLTYAILGPDPVRALWMQLLPGAAAVFLTSWAAWRWRGPAAAWLAGGLLALYKPAIFYTGVLLPPTWAVFLTALALAAVVWARDGGTDPAAAPRRLRLGLAGLAFGLLALAQPAAMILAIPAGFFLWRGTRAGRRILAWFALGAVLPLFATFLYNGVKGGAWSVVAVNGGINLYIGNGPEANGAYIRPPAMREDKDLLGMEAARELSGYGAGSRETAAVGVEAGAREPSGSGRLADGVDRGEIFGPAEADQFWREQAVRYMLENPGRTTALYLRKLLFFFGQYEIPQMESLPFESRYSWLLRFPLPGMAFLTGVALFGAILLYRKDPWARWLVWSAAGLALGVSVFFITARFRIPAAPVLALLAGAGVVEGLRALGWGGTRSGIMHGTGSGTAAGPDAGASAGQAPSSGHPAQPPRMHVTAAAVVSLLAGILLSLNPAGINQEAGQGQHHFRTGVLLEQEGKNAQAEEAYRLALRLDPTLGKAHINLGTLLARKGNLEDARTHLEEGVSLDPQSATGLVNLAQLHQVQGRPEAALSAYTRAIEVEPGRLQALEGAAVSLYELGRVDDAREVLVRVEQSAPPGSPPALRSRNLLGILAEREDAGAEAGWAEDPQLLKADLLLARLDREAAVALYREVSDSGVNQSSRDEAEQMLSRTTAGEKAG